MVPDWLGWSAGFPVQMSVVRCTFHHPDFLLIPTHHFWVGGEGGEKSWGGGGGGVFALCRKCESGV